MKRFRTWLDSVSLAIPLVLLALGWAVFVLLMLSLPHLK